MGSYSRAKHPLQSKALQDSISFTMGNGKSRGCTKIKADCSLKQTEACRKEAEDRCNAKAGCVWKREPMMGMRKKCYEKDTRSEDDLMSALMLDSMDVGVLRAIDDNRWDQDE